MTIDPRLELSPEATRAAREPSALPTLNLLFDFAEAAARLRAHLRALRTAEDVLDAFLLAAGLHQMLEDHLHRDVGSLGKVAKHLPRVVGVRAGAPAAGGARVVRRLGLAFRARSESERALIRWEPGLAQLVQRLAEGVVEGAAPSVAPELLASVDAFPATLRRTVVRLAHCFRSFDQRPEDLARMARSLAALRPDRTRPLLVVGLRTAGSYLAPLAAALLKAEEYEDVEVLTLRPEQDWLESELGLVERAVQRDSLVLVVDEPPRAGSQLVLAARQLEAAGVPREALVLLVPLLASELPEMLRAYETVALPWAEWAVHDQLEPDPVQEALEALLPGRAVESVEPVSTAPVRRGHVKAVYRVALDGAERHVCVEGVGLGYLGRHALAVAGPLAEFLPKVYGVRDGLLYRGWLPEEGEEEEWRGVEPERALATRVASYVHARNRALAVPEDTSLRLVGRGAVWELVADMLAEAFGRARMVVRPLAHRAARRLLRPARPSVVDGSTALAHWLAPPAAVEEARKVDFHERAFSNEDRYCYDPVYDLAIAAADAGPELADELRWEYERRAGEPVGDERWLLYRLLYHHQVEQRKALAEGDFRRLLASERAMARTYQRYVAERFFADLAPPDSGPLCAIDVDWVLEVRWLAIPAISPAAALALRALARHGYRPVVATGRSLDEVRDRCRAYRLAGGVGEYGAVVYDHGSGRVRSLLSAGGEADLHELRAILIETPGVRLDPAHEHGIRAYRLDAHGKRGLDPETIEAALARTAGRERLLPVPALSQTDFVLAGLNKGSGLRALAAELGEERVALAVGDSAQDLPMLEIAERAAAPANADATLRQLVEPGRRPCGAGLLDAVEALLGHRPGRCDACAAPRASGGAAILLAVLGALDGGAREKARQAALLAARLAAA